MRRTTYHTFQSLKRACCAFAQVSAGPVVGPFAAGGRRGPGNGPQLQRERQLVGHTEPTAIRPDQWDAHWRVAYLDFDPGRNRDWNRYGWPANDDDCSRSGRMRAPSALSARSAPDVHSWSADYHDYSRRVHPGRPSVSQCGSKRRCRCASARSSRNTSAWRRRVRPDRVQPC